MPSFVDRAEPRAGGDERHLGSLVSSVFTSYPPRVFFIEAESQSTEEKSTTMHKAAGVIMLVPALL